METKKLSEAALAVIHTYLHLPFDRRDVTAPYYNNSHLARRGGLRVLVGKGSAEDIAEEALIISLRDKIALSALDNETLKKFLVDHRLGVDCSALAYYVLDAECRARELPPLKKFISRPHLRNPLRKLLARLRPVENTGVRVLAKDSNSTPIQLSDARPGDMVIILDSGTHSFNHVLVIDSIDFAGTQPKILHYTHSMHWRSDGRYNHGVRQGVITITNPAATLLDQNWQEQGKAGLENETLERAKYAKWLGLRRLNCLA